MNDDLRKGMLEAARLTRKGQTLEATELIQKSLRLSAAPEATLRAVRVEAAPHALPPPSGERRGAPEGPQAGRFLERSFPTQLGQYRYKLYLPSGWQGQALPLLVMLHGCTQDPDDFAVGTRMNLLAEGRPCFVLYPAQAKSANPSGCWNWFEARHQRRDEGEPALIAGMTRQVMSDYPVDPQRVYVAGLSAGGAMAATLGALYPDLYAAVGVHSGLAYGAASDLPSALAAMRQGGGAKAEARGVRLLPTIVFHGDEDATVHARNAEQLIGRRAGGQATGGQATGGRRYTRTVYRDGAGRSLLEGWLVHGAGHAWAGGNPAGSFTDPKGPDASSEMLRFFLEHALGETLKTKR